MAVLRISYQANSDPTTQWAIQEVGGETITCQSITFGVPSWTIVSEDGYIIECNGQATKFEDSVSIRSE